MSAENKTPSLWQKLSKKRIAFFSRFEGVFLWLLGIPTVIVGVIVLRYIILWLSNGIDIFGGFLTPSH